MKSSRFYSCAFAALFVATPAFAHEDKHLHPHDEEEVYVVSSPLRKALAETALPVAKLSESEIKENLSVNLGDVIDHVPGVDIASFGAGVALPVVRGQSGNRVRVLANSVGTVDAANVSPDHANSLEPLAVQSIEIIKGPSTLLYGNGAIGGVVNVIDNRIPTQKIEEVSLTAEQRFNDVNDGSTSILVLEGGSGDFAFHFDGSYADTDNIDIPGAAVIEFEEEEEHHDEEEGEEHHDEEEEGSFGFVENSDQESTNLNLGGSLFLDNGFVGLSFHYLEKEYGIPPGAHGHEEEGEEGNEEEEEGEEFIRIDLERFRAHFKTELNFDGFWERFNADVTYTDYEHTEVEIVAEDGVIIEEEAGTLFTNEGFESRFTLNHKDVSGWAGTIGAQASATEFAAIGEEAFIPEADITSLSVFAVESHDTESWTFELGLRGEFQEVAPDSCEQDEFTFSGGASALYKATNTVSFSVGVNQSERAASVEELFSNNNLDTCSNETNPENFVVHGATGLVEFGNPNLDTETSSNIELGVRKNSETWEGFFNVYYNKISDFIYLADIDAAFLANELNIPGITDADEFAAYRQEDADFVGAEFSIAYPVTLSGPLHLDIEFFGDVVSAEFDDGGNVPRIPAASLGLELGLVNNDWSVRLRTTEVDEQTDTAENETPTDGYTLVSLYADYHFNFDNTKLVLFAKGNNLLDEEIRRHASFTKDISPEPGRGIEAGVRISF